MKIIDAHQHFWNIETNHHPWLCDQPVPFRYGDYSALQKNYLPEDYRDDAKYFDLAGSVFVEAEWTPDDPQGEVSWVSQLRKQAQLPSVMVAQVWLHRDDAEAVLSSYGQVDFVRGIRHKPTSATAPGKVVPGTPKSMSDPNWRRGYALLAPNGLSFDLQTPWWQLAEARELAEDFPETSIFLNHTGLPADRSKEGLSGWRKAMKHFAQAPNTAVKISGLGCRGRVWSVAENHRVVLETIEIFSPQRCMFASNFPVDGLVGSYKTIMGGFLAITEPFSEAERNAMFHDNAAKFYRINQPLFPKKAL